ncbi:carbohydrate kinase family protein [Candidatus Parcubacteria bacterium]|nr:MAG: carbohydrate kinase family protein [Candidatus Parcubacteria bacterium]
MRYDVLAIGDTAIDDFIRLKDARVNCDINDENCMLSLRFGDKVPFEFNEVVGGVGNSANAAVACARLGLKSAFRTYVGDDDRARLCLDAFAANSVSTEYVARQAGKQTNYHYVLWYESERTILIKHEEYEYAMPQLSEEPTWIYLSSMAEHSLPYHEEIGRYIKEHPGIKVAFQPGTFQMKFGMNALKDIYERTEIFFCNKEEAQRILESGERDEKKLMEALRARGPRTVVVTDGRKGAYAMNDGGAWRIPMYPDPKPPLERTGAGDATSSTTVAYLQLGYPLAEALMRGVINSMSVVQEIGAQKGLLTRDQIEEWYAKRPADFVPTAL